MIARKLPPYGKQYLANVPGAGLWIAIGPGAWKFAQSRPFPVLVLPPDSKPADFRWPPHPGGAVVHERGDFNDILLHTMARELLVAGCPFVVAIREALLERDPRHFFYSGKADARAA